VRRKLFTFAALLSSLVCVATMVLWVRSQYGVRVSLLLRANDPAGHFVPMDSYRTGCVQSADGLFMVGGGVTYDQAFGRPRRASGDLFSRRPPLIFRDSLEPWRPRAIATALVFMFFKALGVRNLV
jgi:hypothetical protein